MTATARMLALFCAAALAGCVEARDTAAQGKSNFIGGLPATSLDYQSGGTGGGSGTSSAGAGAGAGGTSPPPTGGMGMVASGGVGGAAGSAGMIAMAGSGGDGGSAGSAGEQSGGVGGAGGEAGSGGMGDPTGGTGAAGSAGTSGAPSAGTLTIEFTSAGNSGEYAPRNVGAVWIETSSGAFVKTLKRWAGVRANHLTAWNAASGGWGGGFFFASGGGNSADQMDAITGATLRTHQQHGISWDMQDPMGMLVPDGSYRIQFEVTESERTASATASVDFEKGSAPLSLSPSDEGPFKGLSVTYAP